MIKPHTDTQEELEGINTGESIMDLWDSLFWLVDEYPGDFDRQINTISPLLKKITDEFKEISLTEFNFGLTNALHPSREGIPGYRK